MKEIDELIKMYKAEIPKLQKSLEPYKDCGVSSPLLINPCEEYFKQKVKLMIVGQQTHGWAPGKIEISDLMDEYKRFYCSLENKKSPFWRAVRELEQEICSSTYCSIWTNVNRIDVKGDEPCGAVANLIKNFDFILKKEIEILKPNVILFLFGEKFDDRILRLYSGLKVESVNEKIETNLLAKFNAKGLPCCLRTYHPKFLNMQGKEVYDKVLSEIVQIIIIETSNENLPEI